MSNASSLFLQAGYRLTITADSKSRGYYYSLGNPGEQPGSPIDISSSTSVVVGPFNINKNYEIVSTVGQLTEIIEFDYIENATNSIPGLSDVKLTNLLDGDILAWNETEGLWENTFDKNTRELDDLDDVTLTSPQNNQALLYDSSSQLWKNHDVVVDLSDYSPTVDFAYVAFSGSYNDLIDTPDITEISQDATAALIQNGTGINWSYNDSLNTLTPTVTITQYTDEMAQDATASLIQDGTGITWSYNDGSNTLTPTVTITQYTDEMAQDTVSTMIQNGTGISWSYNDGSNTLTPTVSLSSFSTSNLSEGSNLYYTDERVDDRAAALIQNGTGITWSYNDGANTLTPTVSLSSFSTSNLSEGSNLYYTDERVDDRVAALIQNGTGITWSYNDGSNTLTPTVTITQYTDEMAQDAVGSGLAAGSFVTITYNDGANTFTPDLSATGTPSSSKFLRGDNTWAVPASGITITEAEVDFGSTEVPDAKFTITDATVSTSSKIFVEVAGKSPSDSRDLDEIIAEQYQMTAVPGSGSFDLYMAPKEGSTNGKVKIWYTVG